MKHYWLLLWLWLAGNCCLLAQSRTFTEPEVGKSVIYRRVNLDISTLLRLDGCQQVIKAGDLLYLNYPDSCLAWSLGDNLAYLLDCQGHKPHQVLGNNGHFTVLNDTVFYTTNGKFIYLRSKVKDKTTEIYTGLLLGGNPLAQNDNAYLQANLMVAVKEVEFLFIKISPWFILDTRKDWRRFGFELAFGEHLFIRRQDQFALLYERQKTDVVSQIEASLLKIAEPDPINFNLVGGQFNYSLIGRGRFNFALASPNNSFNQFYRYNFGLEHSFGSLTLIGNYIYNSQGQNHGVGLSLSSKDQFRILYKYLNEKSYALLRFGNIADYGLIYVDGFFDHRRNWDIKGATPEDFLSVDLGFYSKVASLFDEFRNLRRLDYLELFWGLNFGYDRGQYLCEIKLIGYLK